MNKKYQRTIRCKKCKMVINDFNVLIKNLTFSRYIITGDDRAAVVDKEYYSGGAIDIIYECECQVGNVIEKITDDMQAEMFGHDRNVWEFTDSFELGSISENLELIKVLDC